MAELSGSDQRRKPRKLSRKTALGLAALAGGVVAGREIIEAISSERSPYKDSKVKFITETHTFQLEYLDQGVDLVLGEFTSADVAVWNGYEPPPEELSPLEKLFEFLPGSTQSTLESRAEHIASIKKIKDAGMQMASLDERFYGGISQDDFYDMVIGAYSRGDLKYLIAAFGVFALIYAPIHAGITLSDQIERRKIAASKGDLNGGNLIVSAFADQIAIAGSLRLLRSAVDSTTTGKIVSGNIQSILGSLGEQDIKEMMEIVDIRSLSMALNAHILQMQIDQSRMLKETITRDKNNDKAEILFFAGSGHALSQRAYENGIGYLDRELAQSARQITDRFEERINKSISEGKSEESEEIKDLVNQFIIITSGFSYPIASYAYKDSYQKSKFFLTDSPRAILWRELIRKMEKETTRGSYVLLGALINEATAYYESGSYLNQFKALHEKAILDKSPDKAFTLSDSMQLPSWVKSRGKKIDIKFSEGIPVVIVS
jgi:hypothetical protein